MATIITPSGDGGGGSAAVAEGTYNATLPALTDGATNSLEIEKDGTLRAGLRARGYGTVTGFYRTGFVATSDAVVTFTGEDGVQVTTVPVGKGITVPGPVTINAIGSGTILGYK